jgi:hypothetical protein
MHRRGRSRSRSRSRSRGRATAAKSFTIHDNGARPFRVRISGSDVRIYKRGGAEGPYTELVASFRARRVYVGGHGASRGHTILFARGGGAFVFASECVYSFVPTDEIRSFYSTLGNSDVPYAVAVGTDYIYLLSEKVRVPRAEFPAHTDWERDAYTIFYERDMKKQGLATSIPRMRMMQERII